DGRPDEPGAGRVGGGDGGALIDDDLGKAEHVDHAADDVGQVFGRGEAVEDPQADRDNGEKAEDGAVAEGRGHLRKAGAVGVDGGGAQDGDGRVERVGR